MNKFMYMLLKIDIGKTSKTSYYSFPFNCSPILYR